MAKKQKKQPRPKAMTPRGFRDNFGAEVEARRTMLGKIAEVYHSYGFDPLETSAIETVEALGSFLPDVDRPNEGVFAFRDDDESWLALRYDLTAPLARVAAQHRLDLPSPYRRYAMGPVWRNEKPGPGRFREFWQCDADTVGTATVAADAEICGMLAAALEHAGIEKRHYRIRINNRRILNGVLEVAGLLDPNEPDTNAEQRGIVLRAIDKLDRLGIEGVRALLGEGRKDDSGDFTKGAMLSTLQIEKIIGFVGAKSQVCENLARESSRLESDNLTRSDELHAARYAVESAVKEDWESYSHALPEYNARMLDYLNDLVTRSDEGWRGVEELREMAELLNAHDCAKCQFEIDPSVVRGLGYYTGPVFEAELTFEITDEKGQKRQFGSVAGGGRYDDLVMRFTGQRTPATGVSIGVDRLLAALTATGRIGSEAAAGPVVILALDRDRMAHYQTLCAELRNAGIRAEVFMGGGTNMGKQLKYADKRAAPLAIIEGGDEAERGVVQIKDLVLGAKLAEEIESNEEWKAQPAQREVARADVLAAVREMLAR